MNKMIICILSNINTPSGSGIMRGHQLYEFFKKNNHNVYFNPKDDIFINYDETYKFIIIIIKYLDKNPQLHANKLKILEKKTNKLMIWDIIDTFQKTSNEKLLINSDVFKKYYKKMDIINCPNKNMMEIIKKNNPLNKNIVFIPHNWDNRSNIHYKKFLKNELLDNIKIAFIGTPNNLYDQLILSNKNELNITNLGRVLDYNNAGTFNVCCCIRTKESAFSKPSTKSYVAASFNCCIIASKDEYGVVDLFGDDYPYYIEEKYENKLDNIKNTIKYMKDTYKTDIWYKALNIVKDVRNKTSIEYIGDQFLKIISSTIES